MTDVFKLLNDKDDKVAYGILKQMVIESSKTNKYLDMIPEFVSMLKAESSFVRTRGFILICYQARWDDKGQIEKVFDQMISLLSDDKPTVVRKCLESLHELVLFRPELSDRIEKVLDDINLNKYKESMSHLIEKDIDELKRLL